MSAKIFLFRMCNSRSSLSAALSIEPAITAEEQLQAQQQYKKKKNGNHKSIKKKNVAFKSHLVGFGIKPHYPYLTFFNVI